MAIKPNYEEVKCKFCGGYYKRNLRTKAGFKYRPYRGFNTVTCSKKCSREYNTLRAGKRSKK